MKLSKGTSIERTSGLFHPQVVTIDGYQDVPPSDEEALLKAVANQPVSVAIEADQRSFQLYAGGVFHDKVRLYFCVAYWVKEAVPGTLR